MARTHILGFPRIGAQRELPGALASFWRGDTDEAALQDVAHTLRQRHWAHQQQTLDFLCAGDFSLYDPMLDHTALLGATPARFGFDAAPLALPHLFSLARGTTTQPAMAAAQWFDTHYHYVVPELSANTPFRLDAGPLCDHVAEALRTRHAVKPVLIGPITYLWLARQAGEADARLLHLPALTAVYAQILDRLHALGIEWVQMDEPALATDLPPHWLDAFEGAYGELGRRGPKLLLASYFASTADLAPRLSRLPVAGFHIDLACAPAQAYRWLDHLPAGAVLSAGVVDGRNVWRNDLRRTLATLQPMHDALGDRLWIAPSCSLLHVPVSLAGEQGLDHEVRSWLAFATEKLDEVCTLGRALNEGAAAVADALD
ncbi:MAG: 5-methyltetrahydropteroyltriglutamate--homocysteine S-methyltransferase, partial [Rhodocyclaceae bacterium]